MNTELEKQSAFISGFTSKLQSAASRAVKDVKATSVDRQRLIEGNRGSGSFLGSMLGSAAEHDVVGAGLLHKGLNKTRKLISDADTYLGSMAAGKGWNDPSKHSLRKTLFTDSKENLIRMDKGGNKQTKYFKQVTVPSLTAPMKEVGIMATPMLAMGAAYDTVDKIRGRNPAQRYSQ